jgi:hypothetical protein
MGFTFSHPALIIPVRYLPQRYYSVTGLIIGSIVPDFEYFIRLDKESSISHTLPGLIWFDLPVSFLLALIFHQLIRKTLIANLPSYFRARLSPYQDMDWLRLLRKNWYIVCYSILAGALTHLLWDSFTSYNGYFVDKIPVFLHELSLGGHKIYVYKLIKHMSSVVGAIAIAYSFHQLKKAPIRNTRVQKYFWLLFAILFVLCLCLFVLPAHVHFSYNRFVKTSISGGLIALLATSLLLRKRTPEQEKEVLSK